MSIYDKYDLMEAMSGADEKGEGKCLITFSLKCHGSTQLIEPEISTKEPIVNVAEQDDGTIQVVLMFKDTDDTTLTEIQKYLKKYYESVEDGVASLDFVVGIFPIALNGDAWMTGINPIGVKAFSQDLSEEGISTEVGIVILEFECYDNPYILPNCLFYKIADSGEELRL